VKGGWYYGKERIPGKTVIITGANTGVGKETARDLARRGITIRLGRGVRGVGVGAGEWGLQKAVDHFVLSLSSEKKRDE
jgi:NAD(P)-dependent dehydrogenase (short-subunit alcohol dehydrogenase family)